jgi:2-oxoisovalerate dehydrogenase E2 component (dihydrolipoyl transacylase)
MATEVRMPQLGESVTEGTVVRWLKQPGDPVVMDESLAEIETEKVNVEIPSPFEGTVSELLVPEGETVEVGVPIATIQESGGNAQARPAPAAAPATATASAPDRPQNSPVGTTSPRLKPEAAVRQNRSVPSFTVSGSLGPVDTAHGMFSTAESNDAAADAAPPPMAERPLTANGRASQPSGNSAGTAQRYSPAVLGLAADNNVDLGQIKGTGLGARITRKDVQSWIDSDGATAPQERGNLGEERQLFESRIAPTAPRGSAVVEEVQRAYEEPSAGAPPTAVPAGQDEELEPLTSTRRTIAAHMVRSMQTSPHAWMMVEVDLSRLVAYRERIKAEFRQSENADLSYLPFMIKAVVGALKQHPRMNSSWTDDGVILKRRINIGVAVDTDRGLIVPVIHDADNLSIAGLARQVGDLAMRARSRRLKIEDVQGGTFTVDNVGPIGSVISKPIINQPQCAIVTMESIVKRPVVIDDAIAIRSIMNCCLSFDHRIVDGGDVGPFMKALKHNLESMGEETPLY